ncbi:MAG: hypothetical protein J4N34_04710, partial [Chloroflexi bacterium]|nr:hypothetical protein [Chloroflexota bacterium]
MPQSGQEMLEESITNCQSIVDGLSSVNEAWKASINEILEKFDEISGTFFFKTMPSVPATRTVMRDSASVLELKTNEDWDGFGPAIEQLIK